MTALALDPRHATIDDSGLLVIAPGIGVDDFLTVGRQLAAMDNALQWWIGDYLNEAEMRGGDYEQASALFNRAPHTLMNVASVARRVPPDRRRFDLTFSHHAEVARIDDPAKQRRALAAAAKARLSVRETRELARGKNPRSQDHGIHFDGGGATEAGSVAGGDGNGAHPVTAATCPTCGRPMP